MTLSKDSILIAIPVVPKAVICPLDNESVILCALPRCGACKRIRRIIKVCDGKRSLAKVAQLLGMLLDRCLQYSTQGISEGWLKDTADLHADAHDLAHLHAALVATLGDDRTTVLWEQAGKMVQGQQVEDWLIVLELSAKGIEQRAVEAFIKSKDA